MDEETGRRFFWLNMKHNFTEVHQELCNTDATVDELGFHSENAIVGQIIEQLRDKVPTDNANPSPDSQPAPPLGYPPESSLPPSNPSNTGIDIANSIQIIDPAMVTLMATLMANMEATRLRIEGNKSGQRGEYTPYHGRVQERARGRGCGPARRRGRNNPRRGGNYCYTYSNCVHASSTCETPGPENKTEATFANMMNGNQQNYA